MPERDPGLDVHPVEARLVSRYGWGDRHRGVPSEPARGRLALVVRHVVMKRLLVSMIVASAIPVGMPGLARVGAPAGRRDRGSRARSCSASCRSSDCT
jgi:hypothetical protein